MNPPGLFGQARGGLFRRPEEVPGAGDIRQHGVRHPRLDARGKAEGEIDERARLFLGKARSVDAGKHGSYSRYGFSYARFLGT